VIEAYLGTGLKNKDNWRRRRMTGNAYQDDRGNKDRSITKEGGGVLQSSPGTGEAVHSSGSRFPDRRHHDRRLRRGAGHPA
jgi:hypothetical protein